MGVDEAIAVFNEMSTDKAVKMMGGMDITLASAIWGEMEPRKAGEVMEAVPIEAATGIVEMVPERSLVARLPEISAQKLWEMPPELLLGKLPSVDAMHLNAWVRPQVAPDLPEPVAALPSDDRSVYIVPEGRESEWALVVASPAPFDRIWAKFTRRLTDVRFVIESLGAEKPSGTPSLPPGRIAASFFSIDVENAAPRDVSAAAAITFVDKSWLDANRVHKWSIEFNRFDEGLNEWVPSPSKRIKEDDERVFFAVVLPGFSKFAIVGSRELPPQRFEVGSLRVSPESPADDGDVEIARSRQCRR